MTRKFRLTNKKTGAKIHFGSKHSILDKDINDFYLRSDGRLFIIKFGSFDYTVTHTDVTEDYDITFYYEDIRETYIKTMVVNRDVYGRLIKLATIVFTNGKKENYQIPTELETDKDILAYVASCFDVPQ